MLPNAPPASQIKLQLADSGLDGVEQFVGLDQVDRSLGLVTHVDVLFLELNKFVDFLIGNRGPLTQLELTQFILRNPDTAGGKQQLDAEDLFEVLDNEFRLASSPRCHGDVILLVGLGRDVVAYGRERQGLVLGGQSGGGAADDVVAVVQADGLAGERQRQTVADGRIAEGEATAVGDVADLDEGHRQDIHCKAGRLAVEVAAGEELVMTVALGKDQRVIGSGVDLNLDEMLDIVKVLAADALDLRHAAEAVVILHALLIMGMHNVVLEVDLASILGDAGAALDQTHDIGGSLNLTGVGTSLLDALVERASLAADGFKGQSRSDLRELVQTLGVMDVQARHSGEHRGTVEQRQAVFGLELELDWGNASLLQRFLRGHTLALIECFRLRNANEDGDNVSHGSEVAAGADAACQGTTG